MIKNHENRIKLLVLFVEFLIEIFCVVVGLKTSLYMSQGYIYNINKITLSSIYKILFQTLTMKLFK